MSATNRGSKRMKADFYQTPVDTIENFLNNYRLKSGTILEPCAGNGNFVSTLRSYGYNNKIIANELREEEYDNLLDSGADEVYHYDFLDCNYIHHDGVKTIITNPPFSLAQEFLEKCFELYPNAEVIMLLRLAFLESKKRYDFWQQHPVDRLYVLSKRPSFINGRTDATAYAFFVWNKSSGQQEIKVI